MLFLFYCSKSRFLFYRDLKTGNILVDQDFKLKIADFGYAKLLRKKINVNRNLYTTLAWTAPEVFKAKGYNHKIVIILNKKYIYNFKFYLISFFFHNIKRIFIVLE